MKGLTSWWTRMSDVQKAFAVIFTVGFMAFGAGVQADFVTEVPRTARENRVMLLSLDSTIARHGALPAHPPEARARAEADSLLLHAIQRGDSIIIETLRWTLCVERLDRREPTVSPTRVNEVCPPPSPIGGTP